MNDDQVVIWKRLMRATLPPASYDKRFRNNIGPTVELSDKQAAYLLKLDHRYRRQAGGAHVCTDLCATYKPRRAGECFDVPLPRKLKPVNVSRLPRELPLFD